MRTVLAYAVTALVGLFVLWLAWGVVVYARENLTHDGAMGIMVIVGLVAVPYLIAQAVERHDRRVRAEEWDRAWMEFRHRYGIEDNT